MKTTTQVQVLRRSLKLIPSVLTLALIFSGTPALMAQNGAIAERIDAEKTEFFTRELALTAEESARFWPVYNDYSYRKEKINRDRKVMFVYFSENRSNMSEAEIKENLDNYISLQKKETELAETYHHKFLEILPPVKVMMIYVTENEFRAHLLRQIRENRQGAGPGGRLR